jgi:DNA adenine methylase
VAKTRTTPTLPSPLKWHGGKAYLAARLVAMMPPHLHYVEPYAGGLSVLLAKDPEGVSEVANDVDRLLTRFWAVMACPDLFRRFERIVQGTPFSEDVWVRAAEVLRKELDPNEPFEGSEYVAAAFFAHCRQSLAGRMESFAPLSRTRVRRGMNEQASAWLSAVEGLPAVHERLKRVVVLNRDATAVIDQQDGPETLFYLDPPYLKETRTAPEVYAHEMTEEQHRHLLMCCTEVKGRFLLSGYRSALYDEFAATYGWHRADFDLPNNIAGGKAKRRMTECVWTNFTPAGA